MAQNFKILIVEDEEIIRLGLQAIAGEEIEG